MRPTSLLRRLRQSDRGAPAPPDRAFWAFISNSHADETWLTPGHSSEEWAAYLDQGAEADVSA